MSSGKLVDIRSSNRWEILMGFGYPTEEVESLFEKEIVE
jgi:hypothetical protein